MLLIANPSAAGGRIGREFHTITSQLRTVFPGLETTLTAGVGDGAPIAAQAARDGHTQVLSLGGDGTHSEIAAGLASTDLDVQLGILHGGTGGDFSRLLGRGTLVEQARRLADGPAGLIDLIEVAWTDPSGASKSRIALNEVSLGMAGEVCARVNQSSKRLGGTATFLMQTLRVLLSYRPQPIQVTIDDEVFEPGRIKTVLVCNGQWAGGGMHFAPNARLADGLLDLVIILDAPTVPAIRMMPDLYNGRIVGHPLVQHRQGRQIAVKSLGKPLMVEADGEVLHTTPLTLSVMPSRLPMMGIPPAHL
jgi:YegS/Rv2252/BmrU family lipid kinase